MSACVLRKSALTIYHVLQQDPQTSELIPVIDSEIRGNTPDLAALIVTKLIFSPSVFLHLL